MSSTVTCAIVYKVFQATGTALVVGLSGSSVCLCCAANVLDLLCGKPRRQRELVIDHLDEADRTSQSVRCIKNGCDLGSGSVKIDGEILELLFLPEGTNFVALGGMVVSLSGNVVELKPSQQVIEQFLIEFPDRSQAQRWTRYLSEAAHDLAFDHHSRLAQLQEHIRRQQVAIDNLSIKAQRGQKIEERYVALSKRMKEMEAENRRSKNKMNNWQGNHKADGKFSASAKEDSTVSEAPLKDLDHTSLDVSPPSGLNDKPVPVRLASGLNAKSLPVRPATSLNDKSLPVRPATGLNAKSLPVRPPAGLDDTYAGEPPAGIHLQASVLREEEAERPAASLDDKSVPARPPTGPDDRYVSLEETIKSLAQGLERLEKRIVVGKVGQSADKPAKRTAPDIADGGMFSPASEAVRTQLNGRVSSLMQRLEMLERHAEMGVVAQRVSQLEKMSAFGNSFDRSLVRSSSRANSPSAPTSVDRISQLEKIAFLSGSDDRGLTRNSSQPSSPLAPISDRTLTRSQPSSPLAPITDRGLTQNSSRPSSPFAPTSVENAKGQVSSRPSSPRSLEKRGREPTAQTNEWTPRLEIPDRQLTGHSNNWTPRLEMSDKLAVTGAVTAAGTGEVALRVDEFEKRTPISVGDSYVTQSSSSRSQSPTRESRQNWPVRPTDPFPQRLDTSEREFAEGAPVQRVDKVKKRVIAAGSDDRSLSQSCSQPSFATTESFNSQSWFARQGNSLMQRTEISERLVVGGAVADRVDKFEKAAFTSGSNEKGLSQSSSQPVFRTMSDKNESRLKLRQVLKERLQIFESPSNDRDLSLSPPNSNSSPEQSRSRFIGKTNSLTQQLGRIEQNLATQRAEDIERGLVQSPSPLQGLSPVRERSKSPDRSVSSGRGTSGRNTETTTLRQRLEMFAKNLDPDATSIGDQGLAKSPSQPIFAPDLQRRKSPLVGRSSLLTQSMERLDRSAVAQRVDELVDSDSGWTPSSSQLNSLMASPEMLEKRETRGAEAVRMWRRRFDPEAKLENS